MSVESHDLGPVPNLTALSGYGDSYVVPGDEVYVVAEDCDYIYQNTGSNPVADGFNIIKAIFLPGVWQRRSSGGGAGALRFNTIAVGALGSGRLIDTSLAGLVDGTSLAWVESVKDTWRWDATSTATADNITVCNPTANGVNPGRFIRLLQAAPEWMLQTTWVVDAAGNNENVGDTALTAIASPDERQRRMGAYPLWLSNTSYHLRYLSNIAAESLDGQCGTNTTIYLHASMNDREGVTPPLYSGAVDVVDALDLPTNTPWAITSNGLAVNWAGLIDKRIRLTSGTNINALSWAIVQDGVTAKKAQCAEFLIPVASFSVAPFVAPATTTGGPAATDTFVVEDLRVITRLYVNLSAGPNTTITTNKIVLDSLSTTIFNGSECGIYSDGSQVSTGLQQMAFHTMHQCKLVSILDIGLKSVLGGYPSSTPTILQNDSNSFGTFSRVTVVANRQVLLSGSGGGGGGGQTWSVVQVGMYGSTSVPQLIFAGIGVRFPGPASSLYGKDNTAPFFQFQPRSAIILATGVLTVPAVTANPAQCILGVNPFTKTSAPAFDPTTGLFTAPRVLSFANIQATVAAGGFNYVLNDPEFGCGFRQ